MFGLIKIKGFRGFEAIEIAGLTRVNLFVGANNAGKTSALEAVELLAGGPDATVLEAMLMRRGEMVANDPNRARARFDVRGLFHGRNPDVGAAFAIDTGGQETFACQLALNGDDRAAPDLPTGAELQVDDSSVKNDISAWSDLDGNPMLGLGIRTHRGAARFWPADPRRSYRGYWRGACRFVGTAPISVARLGEVWDRVALTEREAEVIQTLQIIEPRVQRIAPIRMSEGLPDFVVQLSDSPNRVPLGSMGEGMRRLLALALVISDAARGGVLLIDEIDTGLHYTVMQRMWRMLIEAARTFDLQVFATSHSLDCLMALSRVTANTTELGPEVSVHRFEVGASSTVRFDAAELATAIAHELEVR